MAHNGKITKTVITDDTIWRDARYAALYVGVNKRQIGKLCRDGNMFPNARKHPHTGKWTIPDNDVTNARITIENERRAKIELSFETGQRMRPTTASCKRIRKRVSNDDTLTPDQIALFVSRIDAYQKTWDAKYAERGNKS
ncbi:unnamed protein product [marine sediment metagenome]|uniref:Uncharacterized protein n=1 Tax=marine sediment metagenome TaxID=412755 RepID=X0UPV9_9ZZZZ